MKSGTSSLYHHLVRHPQVCGAVVKEPEFFSERQSHGYAVGLYNDLWEFDPQQHRVALEASTGYTKFPIETNVPQRIASYGIRPKFIYIVRNPFDRIISQYNFALSYARWRDHDVLSEKQLMWSSYFLQLSRFREFFPKDRFFIVDFDHLVHNAQQATNEVFDFLDLPPVAIGQEEVFNKTHLPRKSELLLKRKLKPFAKRVPPLNKAIEVLTSIDPRRVEKKVLSQGEYNEIRDRLKPDMLRFADEYDFDIGKWGF